MITTNLITFELSFKNSSETIIFNITKNSLLMVASFLKENDLQILKIKEFERSKSKFKQSTKARLIACTDHCTELNLILTKK